MIDRSLPPPPGPLRPFRFPAFQRARLANGLTVFAARQGSVPLVSLELVTQAGGQHSPAGQAGLASLTASLLDEGTARRTALEIAGEVENLGGYLVTGADWDVGYLGVGLLSSHLERGLELLAEVATAATFPEAEIERLRRQRLTEILRRTQDPSAVADERLLREIYHGTVYEGSLLGTEESVRGLGRDAITAFFHRHYGMDGSFVIAVGDLDPGEVTRRVEAVLGGAGGTAPPPPGIRPAPLGGVAVHLVDRPGAAQAELRLGHPCISRTHPDYVPLMVANALLGGKFTSRINLNLRERHGYTYGASSRLVGRQGPGPFLVSSAVATESAGAAAREVLSELRRLREEPVEVAELEETLSYLTGVFPYTLQTIGEVAKRLETLGTYGLPDDYYESYLERIGAVTREDILEAARRHIHPERIAVVAVGPAEALERQFEGLGPVTVWSPQAEPQLAG
ncbi:MAG TPA: pitrilysin family protein [Thermoanaerobaculia bacterium]|nr:pitrilysin family protein [Thermoanaerobaculia bacterium]